MRPPCVELSASSFTLHHQENFMPVWRLVRTVSQYFQNRYWRADVDDQTMWSSASVDSDLLKVRVYGALVHCIKDTESEHFITVPKSVRQVKSRLSQLRHFAENVSGSL